MKRRLKLTILWVLRLFGLFRLARLLTCRGFTIIGWHGVSLTDEHERHPGYFVTAETLRRRLSHLQKHFHIVTLDEALAQHANGSIRSRQVVLTFDDGMNNFASRAAPVLREFGLSATVFVVTNTLRSPTQSYQLLIQDILLLTTCEKCPGFFYGIDSSHSLKTLKERQECGRLVNKHFGTLSGDPEIQAEFIQNLAAELRVELDDLYRRRVWHYLTMEEVCQLSNEGFSMQVHTHSHCTVIKSPDTVQKEAQVCRCLLEQATGKAARDYCYPSGLWNRKVWKALEDAGMRSAVTCKLGPNFAGTPVLALRRFIDMEKLTQLEFEFAVSGLRWLLHIPLHPLRLCSPSEADSESTGLF